MKTILPKNSWWLAAFLFAQCSPVRKAASTSPPLQASIVREGFFDCFEPDLRSGGKPMWCEASAIVYDGQKLLLANDKDMPDQRASVFYWAYRNHFADTTQAPVYSTNPLLKKGSKYEDFARTPDGRYILLSTAFDRVKPGRTDWDAYNTILYWKAGHEEEPKVLTAVDHESDSTSISLRPLLTAALASDRFPQGPPYYKIEGLAATAQALYFGIREEGQNYEKFHYAIKILSVPYVVANDRLQLNGPIRMVANINADSLRPGKEAIAISSIEYDAYNKRFLVLTSYENGSNMGGYLWSATSQELQQNRLLPVKDRAGQLIFFRHKSEDLAIVGPGRIIVVHDDDRQQFPVNGETRRPYQAAYSIVDFTR